MAKKLYIEDGETLPAIIIQDAVETAPTGFTEGTTIANFLQHGVNYGMTRHEVIVEAIALVSDWSTHDAGEKALILSEIENNIETFEVPQEIFDDINAPYKGFKVFNTSTGLVHWWNGSAWIKINSVGTLVAMHQDIKFDNAAGTTGYLTYENEGIISSVHVGSGANNTSSRYCTFVLPDDFASFPSDALAVVSYRFGTPDLMTVSMYKVNALPIDIGVDTKTLDAGVNAQSILPTANDTFEEFKFTPAGSYAAGDMIAVFIDDQVDNSVYSEILSIKLKYNK